MEKKTIGKFIQALRRAQGMTQRELADQLYVSDKTVSRWECDECTPELSLIPTIAEIFNVTTDELLRGERRSAERMEINGEDEAKRLRAKSEKQFRTMLRRRMTHYKNLIMLSRGLLAAGIFTALICNFVFFRGLLAFFLGAAFLAAGVITAFCFATSARLTLDEEDEAYLKETETHNRAVVEEKWRTARLALYAFALILPFTFFEFSSIAGLDFTDWFGLALLCIAVALLLVFVLRTTIGGTYLEHHEGFKITEDEREFRRANRQSAKKTLAVFLSIAAVLMITIGVLNGLSPMDFTRGEVLEDVESFQRYMAEEGKRWSENRWGLTPVMTTPIYVNGYEEELDTDHDDEGFYDIETLYDGNGNIVCEYISYFDFVCQMEFSGDELFPITVYTAKHLNTGVNIRGNLVVVCIVLMIADVIVGCLYYGLQVDKNKKRHLYK